MSIDNKKLDKFLQIFDDTRILSLGEMIRYNNRPKIKNESVATHTFIAAASLFKICDYYKIDRKIRQRAIEYIIVHDIPELVSNDLSYDFKRDNQELRDILRKAELNYIKNNLPEYYEVYSELDNFKDTEPFIYLLVKMADVISVYLYTSNEINLGNSTHEINDIFLDTINRINELDKKIEKYLDYQKNIEAIDNNMKTDLSKEFNSKKIEKILNLCNKIDKLAKESDI